MFSLHSTQSDSLFERFSRLVADPLRRKKAFNEHVSTHNLGISNRCESGERSLFLPHSSISMSSHVSLRLSAVEEESDLIRFRFCSSFLEVFTAFFSLLYRRCTQSSFSIPHFCRNDADRAAHLHKRARYSHVGFVEASKLCFCKHREKEKLGNFFVTTDESRFVLQTQTFCYSYRVLEKCFSGKIFTIRLVLTLTTGSLL